MLNLCAFRWLCHRFYFYLFIVLLLFFFSDSSKSTVAATSMYLRDMLFNRPSNKSIHTYIDDLFVIDDNKRYDTMKREKKKRKRVYHARPNRQEIKSKQNIHLLIGSERLQDIVRSLEIRSSNAECWPLIATCNNRDIDYLFIFVIVTRPALFSIHANSTHTSITDLYSTVESFIVTKYD
jgi:hypothetical protein